MYGKTRKCKFCTIRYRRFWPKYLKKGSFHKIDLVMSDIAPNISGIESADVAAVLHLAEIVTEIALSTLNDSGNLLIKLFQGKGTDEFLNEIRKLFRTVRIIKPKASKTNSRDIYMLATKMKVNNSGSIL